MRTPSVIAALLGAAILSACQPDFDEPPPEPPAGEPFFVGRWAASEAMCRTGAWAFTTLGVTTAGEVSCTFDAVTQTVTGYDVDAICTAEGTTTTGVIRLSYAQSAQALLVEGGPFSPVGLVACR